MVLILAALLFLLVSNLSRLTLGETALTRTMTVDAEHFYRSEAIVARIANRLKKRPWTVRFYAEGGVGSGPFRHQETGEYRGAKYSVWVEDVVVGSGPPLPGLVDVVVEIEFETLVRRFHHRVALFDQSARRTQRVVIEYVGRLGEDPRDPAGRKAAADRASQVLLEETANRTRTAARLTGLGADLVRVLSGGQGPVPTIEGPEATADRLIASGGGLEADRSESDRLLRTGIHLLGEDGGGFQSFLPAMERGRFQRRAGNHTSARTRITEARDRATGDLRTRILTTLILARSWTAEAWKRGPAHPEARDMLRTAEELLQTAADEWRSADAEARAGIDPTLATSIFVELARVAMVAGKDSATVDAAIAEASTAAGGAPLYGGQESLDQVLVGVVDALSTEDAVERIGSDVPLAPTGFPPVTEAEAESFARDPAVGWTGWPTDSGVTREEWDEIWKEEDDRMGEGGTGESPPDIDRDGDGVEDPDEIAEETDSDGTPVSATATDPVAAGSVRAAILACDEANQGIGLKRGCMRAQLDAAVANGLLDFHMHDEKLASGVEVHMKIRDGKVANDEVKQGK